VSSEQKESHGQLYLSLLGMSVCAAEAGIVFAREACALELNIIHTQPKRDPACVTHQPILLVTWSRPNAAAELLETERVENHKSRLPDRWVVKGSR
jgi:hypothetical protein